MAGSARVTPRRQSSPAFWRGLLIGWRRFFAPDDFTTLVIVLMLLTMPALALTAAGLPVAVAVVLPVMFISTALGLVLSRSQFGEFLALVVSITYGTCIVVIITALSYFGTINPGVYTVFVRSVTWLIDATSGGINQDDMVFTLLVATLFWFLGYNSAWHVFRIDRVWRVILPPGVILITSAVFYSGNASLNLYIAVFVFTALMLIVRSHLDAREWEWHLNGVRSPRHLRGQFLRVGAALGLIAVLAAWAVPSSDLQERLDRFQQFLQSDPMQQLSEFWNRLFSPVETQGPTTADYYGGDSLELGGAIRLGDQTVFLVNADPGLRYYWRSRVFDTYESGRWTSAADIRLTDGEAPFTITTVPELGRRPVQQTFTLGLNTSRLIYTAPQPSSIDLPARADLRYIPSAEDPNRSMNISVIRPTRVLRQGDTYTATSWVSTASASELRAADEAYAQWVRDLYFYVSPSINANVYGLAQQIVREANAVTAYDKAKAIESWLRANITYNETIPQPPPGRDPVEWVLFEYRQGYCNYYASAMIVMLRIVGVPARMAAGFSQGKVDPVQNAFVVTERDAHTWVEVYFPGYGWVEFEPTAAQAPLNRQGDENFSQQEVAPEIATATPEPTATPAPTATPPATVTPPPSPTAPDGQQQNENSTLPTPTLTPTVTPSPTATPVIVPTQPPPITQPPPNSFDFLLPALGFGLLGLLIIAVVVLLGLFLYWWWEWRGMKGLSPITRAYKRLERYIDLIGVRLAAQQTPEERRREIVRSVPRAERPVTAITRLYMTERYGPGDRHPAEAQQNTNVADNAWSSTRKHILRRWAQRLLPWRRRS